METTTYMTTAISLSLTGNGFAKEFGQSIVEQLTLGKVLSVKQTALLTRLADETATLAKLPKVTAGHVGAVGERLKGVVATVTFVRHLDTAYGVSTLVKLVTLEGEGLATFTKGALSDAAVGEQVTIAGTVKSHGDYHGVPETMLTRVTIA